MLPLLVLALAIVGVGALLGAGVACSLEMVRYLSRREARRVQIPCTSRGAPARPSVHRVAPRAYRTAHRPAELPATRAAAPRSRRADDTAVLGAQTRVLDSGPVT